MKEDFIDTLKAFGLCLIVLGLPIAFLIFFRGEIKKDEARREAAAKAAIAEAYEKGFWAGSRATLRDIRMDTNTGKWTLEITNVLNALGESR